MRYQEKELLGEDMRKVFLMLFLIGLSDVAVADCVCRCVNGEVKALCSSSIDLQPICSPTLCPLVPPSIAPLPSPQLPPLGTSACRQVQVLNPRTNQYEWQRVCR